MNTMSNPPIPKYVFNGRARIANALWERDARNLPGEAALNHRLHVVKDLAALYSDFLRVNVFAFYPNAFVFPLGAQ